jgi:hypothetical protein
MDLIFTKSVINANQIVPIPAEWKKRLRFPAEAKPTTLQQKRVVPRLMGFEIDGSGEKLTPCLH